jgi:F0F1-type ATP synthase assembly protein I
MDTLKQHFIPSEQRATILSGIQILVGISQILVGPLLGYIMDLDISGLTPIILVLITTLTMYALSRVNISPLYEENV